MNVSFVSLLLKCKVSFTDLHTSQESFFPPHGLDLPSASTLGNTAQTRWSLRCLSFLKPIIGTFVKTTLWATSGVSKRCNSAFLQWHGWNEEEWRHWWLSVALTYKSGVIFPSVNETETSEKLIDVWDHSAVNFIVAVCHSNIL